jgi:hypothetical protein
MNLTRISNLFNLLVQESSYFRSYHFGYHADIQVNTPNANDEHGNLGKAFPHVTWVAPPEGVLDIKDLRDAVDIEIYFYNTQDYDATNNPTATSRTMLVQWNELKARAVEFAHAVDKVRGYSVKDKRVEWFADANTHIDSLLCIGLRFTLLTAYTCPDYESDPPLSESLPTSVEAVNDLEVP